MHQEEETYGSGWRHEDHHEQVKAEESRQDDHQHNWRAGPDRFQDAGRHEEHSRRCCRSTTRPCSMMTSSGKTSQCAHAEDGFLQEDGGVQEGR